MNTIILILLSLSLISSVLIIYLNFKSKNETNHEKENQEIERLNQEIINLKESLNLISSKNGTKLKRKLFKLGY